MSPFRTSRSQRSAAVAASLSIACVAARSAQDSPVTVPIRVVNNHVHLRMTSGGHDISLIYDTGAGTTLLDVGVAETLGFKLGSAVGVGGGGATPVRGFRLSGSALALPEDPTVKVTPSIAFPMVLASYEGIPVNGILGADFTRQRVVQLDYAGQRMILRSRSFRYSGNGIRLPLTFKDGQPHIVGEIVLADSSRLHPDCVIDVGASSALILTQPFVEKNHLLERVGPSIRRRAGRGVGGSSWATIGRVAAVRLGSVELRTPVTALYGDSAGVFSTDRNFECNIGGDILRRFIVYLDYARSEMILEPTAAINEPFEADMSGAAFRVDSAAGGLRVSDVMPRGPAEAAGLREDDLIVAIDDHPALDFGMEALRRRLRQNGGEVQFSLRRGSDQLVIIRLPVRRMI